MITNHGLLTNDEAAIGVFEYSNLFTVWIVSADDNLDQFSASIDNLSLDDLKKLRDKLSVIIGYYD